MVRLAMHNGSSPTTKQWIAKAEEISSDYVEQILVNLRTGGLVQSHRGTRGGFSLARNAGEIVVEEVLEAMDGPLELAPCSSAECRRSTQCVTRSVWSRAENALKEVFSAQTVEDLAEEAKLREAAGMASFDI